MKATEKVTLVDYYSAFSIINGMRFVAPKNSPMAIAMIQTAEKIIQLYLWQKDGVAPKLKIKNPANLLATHIDNVNLFMEIRIAKAR